MSFVASETFKLHLKHSSSCAARHPQIFKCVKCGQIFDELSQLQLHIRKHEAVQDSSNSIVIAQRNTFATEESKENIFINFNYQLYNEGGKKSRKHRRFECEYCGKAFSRSGSLQRHLCTHTGDKPFKCEYCGKAFIQSGYLQRHLHTQTGDKPFKCKYCGKAYSVPGHKPFKCEYCGKAFIQSGHLLRHLRTHTGDKPFKCEYCGKAFGQSGNLQYHLRTHTGDKPFKCEYCGKAFIQSGDLQHHLRTHTGDKPFKCEYCGKAYSVSGSLQYHLRTHTGDKPFKCDEYCGKAFSQSGTLQSSPGRRGGSGGSNEPPRSSRSSAKLCPKSRNTQARAARAYARLGCFIFTRHALARARESTAVFVGLVQQESFF